MNWELTFKHEIRSCILDFIWPDFVIFGPVVYSMRLDNEGRASDLAYYLSLPDEHFILFFMF